MQQSNLPLYPKTISIYNKILQLGIAVVLIVAIFSFWFTSFSQTQNEVSEQFKETGQNFIHQAVVTIKVLMKHKRKKELKEFIESLSKAPLVHEARLYDAKGGLIAHTPDSGTVKALYGIDEALEQPNQNSVPFVTEVRGDKLLGYLRVNLKRDVLTEPLDMKIEQQAKSVNLMIVLAGFAGFLLTRGLSRFSRKSLEPGKPLEK